MVIFENVDFFVIFDCHMSLFRVCFAFVIVSIEFGDLFEEVRAEYQPGTLRFDRFRPG